MAKASLAKKIGTLGWSIGLGVVLIMLTTVVLSPSTKSARTRFDRDDPSAVGAPDAGGDSRPVMSGSKSMGPPSFFNGDGEEEPAADGTLPAVPDPMSEPAVSEEEGPIMFGSKAPVVPLFNGESSSSPELPAGPEPSGKLVPSGGNSSSGPPEPPTTLGAPYEFDPYSGGLDLPEDFDRLGPPPSPVPHAQGSPLEQRRTPQQGGTP